VGGGRSSRASGVRSGGGMKKLLIVLVLGWSMVSHAEFRTWQDRAGNTLEAEYIKLIGDKVWVRDRTGVAQKLTYSELSENGRLYVQLMNPPALSLKLKTNKFAHKPEGDGEWDKFTEQVQQTRTDKSSYTCSVDIKRDGRKHYEPSLHLHVYWISIKFSTPEEKRHSGLSYAIALRKQESKLFKLDAVERGKSWVWDTGSEDFIRKEWKLLTRRNEDGSLGEQYRIIRRTVLESDEYYGVLVVVVDERGEILAMDSDKPKLEKIHREIMSATEGQVLNVLDSHD